MALDSVSRPPYSTNIAMMFGYGIATYYHIRKLLLSAILHYLPSGNPIRDAVRLLSGQSVSDPTEALPPRGRCRSSFARRGRFAPSAILGGRMMSRSLLLKTLHWFLALQMTLEPALAALPSGLLVLDEPPPVEVEPTSTDPVLGQPASLPPTLSATVPLPDTATPLAADEQPTGESLNRPPASPLSSSYVDNCPGGICIYNEDFTGGLLMPATSLGAETQSRSSPSGQAGGGGPATISGASAPRSC